MKNYLILILAGFLLGCAASKKTTGKAHELDGTWIPVKQEINGQELPAVVFEKQKLVLNGDQYTLTAESIDKGTVKRGEGNKMDIYGKEGVNAGKHFKATWKLENGLLTICYDLTGQVYPENFETKGHTMRFTSTFRNEYQWKF